MGLQWTKKEDNLLRNLMFTRQFSIKQIGNKINRPHTSCRNRAILLKIKNNFIYKKYEVNENFWSNPNLLNSYWAGFSAADACIENTGNNKYKYTLSLSTNDAGHLKQLKKDCQYNGKIMNRIDKKSINNNKKKIYYNSRLSITCAKWGIDLKKNFNISPNKTFRLSPPNLNKYLLISWLIGYIDGDGCISIKNNGLGLRLDFISGSRRNNKIYKILHR